MTERVTKTRSGIFGLDQILNGGLPKGRTALITGNSGTGKTLLGTEFLVNGIRQYEENGVLVTFEESAPKVAANASSLGFNLNDLQDDGKLVMLTFKVGLDKKGDEYFNFAPLLVLLEEAIERVGAKRVMLDTIELLFGTYSDETTMRIELVKLMRWLEDRGVTTVITGESGKNTLTRYGIEEYVSDCVIALDHRVRDGISTRLLRVLKYRGSAHGTNEYPFLIGNNGFIIRPITSMLLNYPVSTSRVATGIPEINKMLSGGLYRGSTTLITGDAGSGKTSIEMSMVNAACARGEKCLVLLYEESALQLQRNMEGIGINLKQWIDSGMLKIWAAQPLEFGLENHLAIFTSMLDSFKPAIVAVDGLTAFGISAFDHEVFAFVFRKINIMKSRGLTAVFTGLGNEMENTVTSLHVSSLVDTWILLRNMENNGELTRILLIVKSHGTKHSSRQRELTFSSEGIHITDASISLDRTPALHDKRPGR